MTTAATTTNNKRRARHHALGRIDAVELLYRAGALIAAAEQAADGREEARRNQAINVVMADGPHGVRAPAAALAQGVIAAADARNSRVSRNSATEEIIGISSRTFR